MKQIFYALALLTSLSIAFSACDKFEDDLFDKDPATRQDEQMADFRRVLNNNNYGWALYVSMPTYQHHPSCNVFAVRFDSIWSTFYSSSATSSLPEYWGQTGDSVKSMYSLKMDNGVCLSFDTYNGYFHYYSDQSDYFATDLQADFEFVLDRYSQNEDTIFGYTKVKTLPYMMVKMDRPADQYQVVTDAMDSYAPGSCKMHIAGEDLKAGFLVGYKNLGIFFPGDDESSIENSHYFTYGCVPGGIYMVENIEYGGHHITSFQLNETKDRYVSKENPDDYIYPNPILDYLLRDRYNETFYFGTVNASPKMHELLIETGQALDADGRFTSDKFNRCQFSCENGELELFFNRWEGTSREVHFPLQYRETSESIVEMMWDGSETSSRTNSDGTSYTAYEAGLHVLMDKLFPKDQWVAWSLVPAEGSNVWSPSTMVFGPVNDPDYYITTDSYYQYYYYGKIFVD